ncbi:hypothetical protein KIKIMORA_00600 [Brevundimonas phage vB_BpoS-Kikimora]|uniref:Uncharacterized protein n=1 Tax=Brevundimonas phage vB_BpoS-Kikimora TaxID=2948601 RepID=A0A9E7SMQ2_9CAUD|nr:hypothetical protein KIKIMORA_00600 [Brevundimonas phage vB_BpoS-Kikimora]
MDRMSLSESNIELIREVGADALFDQDWSLLEALLTRARQEGPVEEAPESPPEDPRLEVVKAFAIHHGFYKENGRRRRFYSRLDRGAVYLYETLGRRDHRLVGRAVETGDSYFTYRAEPSHAGKSVPTRDLMAALNALALTL